MNCSFTELHLREILESLRAEGYEFRNFREFSPGADRQVILRHDVDLSLDDAVRIARLEIGLGVTSVFHLLLTADAYNPYSARSRDIVRELRRLGHAVGLHLDPAADPTLRPAEYTAYFQLAEALWGPLDSYSLHRPAAGGRIADFLPEKLGFPVPEFAYHPRFVEEIHYRSDSRREWRSGCICQEARKLEGRSLQLLIHPVWWTPQERSRDEVLRDYLNKRAEDNENYLYENLSFLERPASRDGASH